MKRFLSLLTVLAIIGITNVWGEVATNGCTSAVPGSYGDMETGKLIEWKVSSTNTYTSPIRVYANKTITIHAKKGVLKITQVEVEAYSTGDYVNYTRDATWSASGSGTCSVGNRSTSGKKVTANISGNATTVTISPSSQTRWSSVKVTYDPITTTVTLNKNNTDASGSSNGSVQIIYNETAYKSGTFTAATRTGYNCTGYWTASSGGTKVLNADGTRADNVSGWWKSGKWDKDAAEATLYAQWESAAACEATPTVGAASLNGSFSLTQVGVQCASASAGDNCELEEWGFVWGESNASGRPNYFDDYVVTNSGSYSANYTNTISSSFSTGKTYYYRGYAVNGNEDLEASVGYSSEVKSFTPQDVIFYDNKELNGDEYDYKVVNKGTKVTPKGTPSKTGYTFRSWVNNDDDSDFDCSSTNVDGNLILYADWTVKTHKFAWNFNGGSSSATAGTDYTADNNAKEYNSAITYPANNTMSKTGYNFASWSSSATTMPDNDLTITANWTALEYNITYKDKGNVDYSGSNESSLPATHTYNVATNLVNGVKTGYTFAGWYTDEDCTESAGSSIAANSITADITLYAKWTANTYEVVFDKNGGQGDNMPNQSFTYDGDAKALSANTYTPAEGSHKYFNGWNTETNGTGTPYADKASVQNLAASGTFTLYAQWANHTFTNYRTLCCTSWDDPEVSYSSSSISVNGTATVTIEGTTHGSVSYASSNESVLSVAANGTVTGVGAGTAHVIISWTEADGYCEKTMNSDDFTVQGDVAVTFNANGGSGTMSNQSIPVSTPTALSANAFTAPNTCQYFYGWATSQALADVGTRAYEDEESVTITEGMNLYAIWKTYRYTIATPTKVGAATATLDVAEVDCDGEVTVTSTADASHKGDPTIEITPSDAGTVNGNKIQNIVKNITAVTITYAAKEVYTVTWKVGGVPLTDGDLGEATTSVLEGEGLTNLPSVADNALGSSLVNKFMGWSTSEVSGLGNSAPEVLFTAAGNEPEIDANVTYHAVFAKKTGDASDSWDLCSAVNDVTAGDYVITWNNEKYLPSETVAAKNPAVGTGITVSNNKLTNTVTSDMQWNFSGNNTNGWTVSHKKDSKTHYLGSTDAADGITVAESNSSYTWKVSLNNTYGMLMQDAGTTRYLTVYTPNSGTQTWRYYTTPNGTFRLYRHNVTEATYENYMTKVVALSSIAVTTAPTKTVYKKGATLDLTNMVVTATYADESTRDVTGYTVEPNTSTALTNETKFTVSYTEGSATKTADQAIKVYALSGIAITTDPTTTTYKSGATLSTAGMEVTATWGDEALDKIVETVDGYTVDLSTNLATTDTEYEVSYTSAGVEKKTTKGIHVYDLSGISITAPTKTTYTAGDVFDPAGMVVTATWGGEALDKIVETVDGYTYSEEPLVNDADDPANVNVTISYTSNGVTKTATQVVTVAPKAKKIMTWHVANEDPFTTRIYVNAQDKYILALPDDPDPVAAGFTSDYVFKGWTTATSVNKDGTSISYASAGTEMSDDEDFYAVFAQKNGEDSPAGYRIVDAAPAASETVIIARKVNSTYYAMTNSATPGYDALTITNGVISGTTTSYQWSVASATSGVYLKKSTDYLHMNSKALAVASETTNGDVVFSSNGNGTYKATRADGDRWIVAGGTYGFDCSATEEDALALYIFKYAAATVATYSNYRLVPSAVAAPTGLEAGTYYCASKSITLSQAAGKPIYYTLDGSTPDNTKTLYSSAIVLNTSKTIKAVAYDSDLDDYSGVASAVYTIVTSIAAPTMPATQTFYDESMEAEISHDLTSEGAVIHYSYDDASYSNYSDALTIDETKTVYAYATIGELTSPKASATYTKGVTYTYKKVTSDAGLAVGMKFIIVSGTNGAGAIDGDHLVNVTVPSPNEQSEIAITNQAVKEFTLGGRSGAYQLVSDQGTLGSGLSYTTGTKTWTISYSGAQVTIENTTTSNGKLLYNSSQPRFKTYTSNQSAINIYALPFTAHTLTIKNYDGSDKTTAKVVEGGSFVLTSADAPSNTPGATYVFLNKWTDGTNTYAVNEAVPVGSADVTLQPCWKVTPTANTDINDLPTSVTEIVVTDGKTLEISAGRSLDNLTVEAGGKVSGESALTVNNLTIESEAGKSGQVSNAGRVHANNVYMDVTFYKTATELDEETAEKWYMISAPFDVNLNGGFFQTNGTQMVLNVDYALFEYDGAKRASTGVTGWKRASGKMKAGVAHLIGFNPGQKTTIRLKAANTTMTEKTSIKLNAYGGDDANKNWNGVANPNLHYTNINQDVQVFENDVIEPKYTVYECGSYSFVVGTPFFVQATEQIALSNATHSEFRAPQRQAGVERLSYCVRIASAEATKFADQMYVRSSEEATNSYEQGHDMVAFNSASGSTALIWSKNYGMNLSIEEAPMVDDKASYALSLYAPADGTYRIETPTENEDATLYLTKDGRVMWNLSMSACEVELSKGTTESYGLLLVRKAPGVATGNLTPTLSQGEGAKILIDEHVYILRGGQMYDLTGKAVK